MKFNLFFYGLGFIILIVSNSIVNIQNNNSDYQLATFKRCLEVQKNLNLPLKKCLN